MELTIANPVKKPEPYFDSYSVQVEAMHGDADHEDLVTIAGFRRGDAEDEALLESLLLVLRKMSEAFPSGRGGGREYAFYNAVPEFESWFSSADVAVDYDEAWYEPATDEEREELIELAARVNKHYDRTEYVEWPFDVTMSGGIDLHSEADIAGFEVRYHDREGREYHVDYIL